MNHTTLKKGKTVVSTSCCIWCSTISLISAVILNKLPDPLHLLKLPVSLKKLGNWVQLSHSSLQSTFAIVGAFNLWEWKVKILCFLTYCTPLLLASYTLPTHSLNIHLAFHFTWTFSLLTACDNTEFHCTNWESGKNATRAQPEMKCKLFYWCLL